MAKRDSLTNRRHRVVNKIRRAGDVDYQFLFTVMFDKVLVCFQTGEMFGDYIVFGIRDGQFGLAVVSYSKLPNSDNLLNCCDEDDVVDLFTCLYNDTRTFVSWALMRKWMQENNWEREGLNSQESLDALRTGFNVLETAYGKSVKLRSPSGTIGGGYVL